MFDIDKLREIYAHWTRAEILAEQEFSCATGMIPVENDLFLQAVVVQWLDDLVFLQEGVQA
jgi:hypothetical protein